MELFWSTVQIVGGVIAGILSPFVAVAILMALFYIIIGLIEYFKTLNELRSAKIYETRPFDESETSFDHLKESLTIRLYRKGTKVYEEEIR